MKSGRAFKLATSRFMRIDFSALSGQGADGRTRTGTGRLKPNGF